MKLSEYFQVLSTVTAYDPFLFAENNTIYKLIVECMLKEKTETDLPDYEALLMTVVKIFGKDIFQFTKKLLSAIDDKLETFKIPTKRKRKITNESENGAKKKQKLSDGTAVVTDNFHIGNIWPKAIKSTINEIFADLNVNQTVKLWKLLNDSLRNVVENLQVSVTENDLFKIDFISSLICQLVTSSRIHEHLVYKSTEISSAIDDFNDVQHNFYETIIKIEYNHRIMNAFLKMSYDYENFIMMYFYHFNEYEKSDLDSVFITDRSRIKSGDWKIIQQRIKNFGKVEEKCYSNLLMIQHLMKNKLFKIATSDDTSEFLQNLLADKDQLNLLLDRQEVRLHIFNLLNDEKNLTILLSELYSKIKEDKAKVMIVLDMVRNNSKMLEVLLILILEKHNKQELIEIMKQLPVSYVSHEVKKAVIEKLILDFEITSDDLHHLDLMAIFTKISKNDGFKTFFKDFAMDELVKNLPDVTKFNSVYENIIKSSLKKVTSDVLQNLEWILSKSNSRELLLILAKCLTDIHVNPTNECSLEKVNKLKLDVVGSLSSALCEKNVVTEQQLFCVFSRLCSQNMQIIDDVTKDHHLNLLNKLLKSMVSLCFF